MNMRRLISALVCLGLMAAGVVYLTSCAAQKGPLSPNTSLISPTSNSTNLPYVLKTLPSALVGTQISVSQTVQVFFSTAMNPASFNTGTVLMFTNGTNGYTEAAYTNFTLRYDVASKSLLINPAPNWAGNTVFRIALTSGVTGITGAPLDGNQNGIAEGPAFDTANTWFYTGVPVNPSYFNYVNFGGTNFGPSAALVVNSIQLTYFKPDPVNPGLTVTAGTLPLPVSDVSAALPVTFTVQFSQRLDVATAWAGPTTLAPAFIFTDSNGTPVAPTAVTLTGANNDTIMVYLNGGLAPNTRYQVGIKGGLGGLRSTNEVNQPLTRYLYFAGNGLSYPYASDDTKLKYIYTTASSFATLGANKPPQVSAVAITARVFAVTFTVNSPIGIMDASTLNVSNIQLFTNTSSNTFSLTQATGAAVPKDLFYDSVANVLYVTVPDKFLINSSGTAYFKILINHNVRSADGLYLDGNNDGISSRDFNDDVFTGVPLGGNAAGPLAQQ